ncbi:hypothetical protein GGI07_005281 [Coemansia sp. Benny D115]|nr:hypothetical protein GGI07_005281 [Coemansia sp. Benny D115]
MSDVLPGAAFDADTEASTKRKGLRGVFEEHSSWSADGRETGLLKLFRNGESSDALSATAQQPTAPQISGRVLSVLGVPGYMTPTDFLSFAGLFRDSILHIRVVRDEASYNHYVILLFFNSAQQATRFHNEYNGKTFSPLEPETCHVVVVGRVECDVREVGGRGHEPQRVQVEPEEVFALDPGAGSNESPGCPVCLEKLDGSGVLLTILCQHTFHGHCLARWGDGTCPVCRCSQTAPFVDHEQFQRIVDQTAQPNHSTENGLSRCHECGRIDDLWICLICGSIGCGRYANAHAKDHFAHTRHPYSMKLDSQVVWDYVGDGYVHRLLQSTQDGKLIPSISPSSSAGVQRPASAAAVLELSSAGIRDEKEEAELSEAQLMFSAQLDSLKEHYEGRLLRLQLQHQSQSVAAAKAAQEELERLRKDQRRQEAEHSVQLRKLREELQREHSAQMEELLKQSAAEKSRLEAATARWVRKSTEDARLLADERAMTKQLLDNQQALRQSIEELEAKLADAREEIRDLSFFISTQQAIAATDSSGGAADAGGGAVSELQGASIVGIAPEPPAASKTKSRTKAKKKAAGPRK